MTRTPFSPLHGVESLHLPNGVRVLLKQDRDWPIVSAHAWLRVGSVDETDAEAGLSHVLEHMVFKGTRRYGTEEISRWVERAGGAMNAETSREYTHYHIDIPKEGARQAISILGELLACATIKPAEWARERLVILEELRRRNDDPESLLWDLLSDTVYHDQRLRRAVIGSGKTVSAQTPESIRQYYQSFYTSDRTLIVVVGDFKRNSILSWIHDAFAEMKPGGDAMRAFIAEPRFKPRALRWRRPVQQVYHAWAFPTPPASHEDQETLDLLATLLGEGRNSRLVSYIREEHRLAWSVNAANLTHEGPGMFAIFCECDPKKVPALKQAIHHIISDLGHHPPKPRELDRAKNIIQTGWLQSFETYHHLAGNLGIYGLENHLDRLQTYLERVGDVSRQSISDVVCRYVSPPSFSTAVIHP